MYINRKPIFLSCRYLRIPVLFLIFGKFLKIARSHVSLSNISVWTPSLSVFSRIDPDLKADHLWWKCLPAWSQLSLRLQSERSPRSQWNKLFFPFIFLSLKFTSCVLRALPINSAELMGQPAPNNFLDPKHSLSVRVRFQNGSVLLKGNSFQNLERRRAVTHLFNKKDIGVMRAKTGVKRQFPKVLYRQIETAKHLHVIRREQVRASNVVASGQAFHAANICTCDY